ncbi:gliding motility-associated C-terminal domain-containing protein [Flavobacterium luteolum]|uniref:T9SS type B sorting domain-containing protein n=1 Tax=Flavobacterium luteolum TaxID=3003259 RepID=UPI00248F0EC6|nr:gliding motility-associated C-terminal domain-containing protein [Flavobacterium luteolum]
MNIKLASFIFLIAACVFLPNAALAANPITVSLSAPATTPTFALDGEQVSNLSVNVDITVNQIGVTGGKIVIPVEAAPNGIGYYSFKAVDNPASGWPAMVQNVSLVGSNVEITLKDNVAQGTNQNIYLNFAFNQTYNRKVLPGTVMWNTVDATISTASPAFSTTVSSGSIATSATNDREITYQRMNPITDQTPIGSVVTYRLNVINTNYYKVNFDPGFPVTETYYFPAGTTIVNAGGLTQGVAGDGRVTISNNLPTNSTLWNQYHYSGINTHGGFYQTDIQIIFPGNVGDVARVTGEFSYALYGQSAATVQQSFTFTNQIIPANVWDFRYNEYNKSGSNLFSDCNVRPNGSKSLTNMFPIYGWFYGNVASTRNQGTGDIGGVEWIGKQPIGSAKINYAWIQINNDTESAASPASKFQYWYVIKDATTGVTRSTTSTSINKSTDFALPILGGNEYIDEVHVQPTGTTGTAPGVLPAKNSFGINYQVKTWNGAKWPDGTSMPFNTTILVPFTLTYNDASGVLVTKNSTGITHRYSDYGNFSQSKMVNVDPNGNALVPGQNVNFEIQGSNSSNSAPSDWQKPVVVVKTLPNLKYVSNGDLFSGTDGATFATDEGAVRMDIIHEGSDYNMYRFTSLSNYAVPHNNANYRFKIPVVFQLLSGTKIGTYSITQTAESSDNTSAAYVYNRFQLMDNVPSGETMAMYGFNLTNPNDQTVPGDPANQHVNFSGASGSYTVVQTMNLSADTKILGNADVPAVYHGTETPGLIAPGGTGKMNVILTNKGNVDVSNFKLFDIIPRIGDKTLLTGAAKNTEWDPNFAGLTVKVYNADGTEYTALNGTQKLYYSLTNDPAIPEISRTGAATTWTTTAPTDMNTIGSFKYDFGTNRLLPGQYINIEMTYVVPAGAIVDPNKIAYNSFAYTGTYFNGATNLGNIVAQEPTPFGALKAFPSSLFGTVYDNAKTTSTGPIAGATVTATDKGSGTVWTTTTDTAGYYSFPGIPEGTVVDIVATASGFTTNSKSNVTVLGNVSQDIPLSSFLIANPPAVCSPATVDLTAATITAGSETGLTYTYFTDAAGTIALSNPNAVSVSGTYYIKASSSAGGVGIKPVQVTVNPGVSLTYTTSSLTQCNGSTFTASFTPTPANAQVTWTNSLGEVGSGDINEQLVNNGSTPIMVTYTVTASSLGCTDTKTITVTVNPTATITPSVCESVICSGQTANITFSSSLSSTTINWTADDGTSGTGDISAVKTNTGSTPITITYTITGVTTESCSSPEVKTCRVIVNPLPVVAAIAGDAVMCTDSSTRFIDATPGGVWSSSNPAVATVDATGLVTAVAAGTTIISYTVDNNGCTATATQLVTVNSQPAAPSLGVVTQPTCAVPNGIFQINNYDAATYIYAFPSATGVTVSSTGLVTAPEGNYTVTITDKVSGCTSPASASVTVNAQPASPAQPVVTASGSTSINVGGNVTLTGSPAGGVWSSDNIAIAPVNATGTVTGVTAGTANITYTVTNANGCTASNTVQVTINDFKSFVTVKSVADASGNGKAEAGENLTYTIKVKNTGSLVLDNISISDVVPANTTYVSGGSYDSATQTVSFTGSNLAVGDTSSYSFIVKVANDLTGITTVSNQATATVDNIPPTKTKPEDPNNPGNPDPVCTSPGGCTTDIPTDGVKSFVTVKSVADASGNGKAEAGENLTYTIKVKNTGSLVLNNISISDAVPANTTYVSGGSYDSATQTVSFTGSNLAVGDTSSYSFIVKVANDLTGIATVSNQATATVDNIPPTKTKPEDPNNPGNPDPVCTNVAGCPTDIPTDGVKSFVTVKSVADASGNGKVEAGENLTYTIKVKNTGSLVLNNISISDVVPANTTYVSGGSYDSATQTVSFTGSNLAVGDTSSYSFIVKVANDLTGIATVSNQATATVDNIPPTKTKPEDPNNPGNPDPVCTNVAGCPTDIPTDGVKSFVTVKSVADASGNGKVEAGENLTYTIKVKNTGSLVLNNISISDVVPANTTYVSGGSYDSATQTVSFTGSNLAVGDTSSYSFIVKVANDLTGITTVSNQATATVDNIPPTKTTPEDPNNPGNPDPVCTNPTGCTTTILTDAIDAVADNYTATNGKDGGTTPTVLVNDTLSGVPVVLSDVNLTAVTVPTGLTLNPDGTITVAPNTPAGTYEVTYSICEKLNPTNCDTAIATVVVGQAPIDAVADNSTVPNGKDGGTTPTVLANDTLNGTPVVLSDVNLTGVSVPTGLTLNPDGTITVAPNTPAGTYEVTYSICEKLNPTNCDTAIATVVVGQAPIDAVADNPTVPNGKDGGTTPTVLANDTLNGTLVVLSDVNLTGVTVPTGLTLNPDGTITVAPNTPAGTYEVTYSICEKLNPTNCDTAIATVVVGQAPIDAVADNSTVPNGKDGGTTPTVLANDTLNGTPVVLSDVNLTGVTVPTGLTLNPDGTITVAPNTPAGTYEVTYSICEKLNPTNCDTAIATVVVGQAPIDAVADNSTVPNGKDGGTTPTVLANDTLNGTPVVLSDVNLTGVTVPTGLTLNPDGTITVAPNTPAGTYEVTYSICEKLNPTNCDTATVKIAVGQSVIDAVADDYRATPINGKSGGTTPNVLTNDTLNGLPVVLQDVNLTGVTVPEGLTLNTDGTITVAPNTPAGTYDVTYSICEKLNPTNCDTATVKIAVGQSVIDAVADDYRATPINGKSGGTTPNVLTNDTLNGLPVVLQDVNLTGVTVPAGLTLNTDGTITVAPNTPAGTYDVTYSICEKLNPTNCDTATVKIAVGQAVIDAVADDYSATPINGKSGGTTPNVLTNDTLNGLPVVWQDVNLTGVTVPAGLTLNTDGTITVAPNTPAGTYDVTYSICEKLNPANCDATTATIVVGNAVIDAVDDDFGAETINGKDGGTTQNVLANDTLNGAPVKLSDVELTEVKVPAGLKLNPDGTITVAPNTSGGTYEVVYSICEKLNLSNCDTATVIVEVGIVEGMSDLEVFNALTPNGDGINDEFIIKGIEYYPNNTLEIYNRWGVKVYQTEKYGQNGNYFTGISEGRATVDKAAGLPTGTYFYILRYSDIQGNTKEKSGYLYLNR